MIRLVGEIAALYALRCALRDRHAIRMEPYRAALQRAMDDMVASLRVPQPDARSFESRLTEADRLDRYATYFGIDHREFASANRP